jgi:glycosyltransferase involved in cell wall biosynthesis
MEVLIIAPHQTYTKAFAGGYIRLREFLKHIPKDFDYNIIDSSPSIYSDIISPKRIILFEVPEWILFLIKRFFPFGVLAERIYSSIKIYQLAKKQLDSGEVKILYVPIGEFLHLYLPAVLLKRRLPNVKIIVDILNFEIITTRISSQFVNFIKSFPSLTAAGLLVIHYFTFKVFQKTIKDIDFVFSVSPRLVKEIKKIYNRNTIDFTPSGVSVDTVIPKKPEKVYSGVYLGRVTEQKGALILVETWKKITETIPNARLAIAGVISKDMTNTLTQQIKKNNLENNIKILGAVSEDQKHKILFQSEIFLHLAEYEPLFPVIGILEGLSHGLPVIVFDMPVLKDAYIKSRDSMYVFVAKNGSTVDAAISVVNYLNYSEVKKASISKNAIKYARRFNWENIAKKEFDVIASLLEHN